MWLLESGSLQRMIFMTIIFVGAGAGYAVWLWLGGGVPVTILQSVAIIFLSIGFSLRIIQLEKQVSELRQQLRASHSS